jgi:hypothetical protein
MKKKSSLYLSTTPAKQVSPSKSRTHHKAMTTFKTTINQNRDMISISIIQPQELVLSQQSTVLKPKRMTSSTKKSSA